MLRKGVYELCIPSFNVVASQPVKNVKHVSSLFVFIIGIRVFFLGQQRDVKL